MRIFVLLIGSLFFLLFNPGKNTEEILGNFETRALAHKFFKKTMHFPKIYTVTWYLFRFPKGVWSIPKNANFYDILILLKTGKPLDQRRKITFIEGTQTVQILNKINENPDLIGPKIAQLNEAEIFPDTYFFVKGMQRRTIIETAKNIMNKKIDQLWSARPHNFPLTKKEWVILASIVQKEGKFKDDMQKIASCFLLRIRKKMPLQSDACVAYGLAYNYSIDQKDISQSQNLSKQMGRISYNQLKIKTPFNTYLFCGLPPSAICTPGLDALQAVLEVDHNFVFLYFYTINFINENKQPIFKIFFAKTLKEHNQNKRSAKKYIQSHK